MRNFTRYSRSISGNGAGLPLHRPDNPIGVREDTGVAIRSAGKQFYDPDDGSLVGAWLLDEGSGLYTRDHSIYGNHGLLDDVSMWVDEGILFNGSSDAIPLTFLEYPDQVSIVCWASVTGSGAETMVSWGEDAAAGEAVEFRVNTGFIQLSEKDSGGSTSVTTTSTWDDSTDHCFGFSKDSGLTVRLYGDGVFDTSGTLDSSPVLEKTTIGALLRDVEGNWFTGTMYSLCVYSRPLTDSEFLAIYQAGIYRRTESFKVANV